MILSVSRRTDIPSFYSEWFMNRLHEGFVYIKNPMNANQISKVILSPDVVDCIVFWSKNPEPMMEKIDEIKEMGYKFYFQFTITPYDRTIERGLPEKEKVIDTFVRLSEKIGKDKMVWRYDPIILNGTMTVDYHINEFGKILEQISNYTDECIISFVDSYDKAKRRMGNDSLKIITEAEMVSLAKELADKVTNYGIAINTCAEKINLEEYGVGHASCIDKAKIERIVNCSLSHKMKKDSQRESCGCIECIDLGAYNTCMNGCLYCYANTSQGEVTRNHKNHDPKSALLIGDSSKVLKVSERKIKSFKDDQLSLL